MNSVLASSGYKCIFYRGGIMHFILSGLSEIGRAAIQYRVALSPPSSIKTLPRRQAIAIPSLQLSTVITTICGVSHDRSRRLFVRGLVFMGNGVAIGSSCVPGRSRVVSIQRGKQFIFYNGVKRAGGRHLGVSIEIF